MAQRPVRTYLHTFLRDAQVFRIVAEGRTPCLARAEAFRKFERRVRDDAALQPREQWRLLKQEPVSKVGLKQERDCEEA